MGQVQGFKVRVRIDGVAFKVSKASWSFTRPDMEVPDSEGTAGDGTEGGATDGMPSVGGRRKTKITLERATLDLDDNPFADGIDLSDPDVRHEVDIFPDKSDESFGFNAPLVMFISGACAADVAGLQPVTLEGVVDGDCTLPGEGD